MTQYSLVRSADFSRYGQASHSLHFSQSCKDATALSALGRVRLANGCSTESYQPGDGKPSLPQCWHEQSQTYRHLRRHEL
jgi:hypothetical protein